MDDLHGRTLALSPPRRFIIDLLHFARKRPTVPVSRTMDLSVLFRPREEHPCRPSWSLLFMKGFALVARQHAPLRRSLVTFPWSRLYEHPMSICALALERSFEDDEGIFVGLFRAPESQSIAQLQQALDWYKNSPLGEIGFFRQAVRVSRLPTPVRRFLWWSTLEVSGFKKAKRFGTFGLSSYGSLGAESLHPISPLTTTLTFGPIDADGRVCVKFVYDHRVLDGAFIARRLKDLEQTLTGPIREELERDRTAPANRLLAGPHDLLVGPTPVGHRGQG
jgi:hypothetical protein